MNPLAAPTTPSHHQAAWKAAIADSAGREDDDILRSPDQPKLNLDGIPPAIRAFCENTAARIAAPIEYVVSSVLCVLGAAIGTRCGIAPKMKDNWILVPNLWCINVGEPSSGKSPCMSAAVAPYQALERTLQVSLPKGSNPKRLTTNDSTGEKLVELLAENPHGLLLVRDELSGLFQTFHRKGREGERQLFLQAWNGLDAFTTDRIGRGTVTAERLCLSVMGTIQPDLLGSHLGKMAQDDGFAQRFLLIAYPEFRPRGFADIAEDVAAKTTYQSVLQWLVTSNFDAICTSGDIPHLRLEESAYQAYREWWMSNESACSEPQIATFLQKHTRLVPALALIDHLTHFASIDHQEALPPVPLLSMQRAISLADFFASTVKKTVAYCKSSSVFGNQPHDPVRYRVENGSLEDGFTVRDITRLNLAGYKFPQVIEQRLGQLVECGLLRVETTKGPGRPTQRYFKQHAADVAI